MIGAAISDEELYDDFLPVNKSGFYLRLSQNQVIMAYFGSFFPQQISATKTRKFFEIVESIDLPAHIKRL